jgi:hypothetical protein
MPPHQFAPGPFWLFNKGFVGLLILSCLTVTGCTKLMTLGALLIYGTEIPADFKELQGKRVAVAVVTPNGVNKDAAGVTLSRQISALLAANVKKVSMIEPNEVDAVANDFPSGSFDVIKLGKQLDAEYVLAVQLSDLQLHDGPTLYKGRCKCDVNVYEIAEGDLPVFTKDHSSFIAPSNGLSKTAMDETKFQSLYLGVLAKFIAMSFHPHERGADVGIDAVFHSF